MLRSCRVHIRSYQLQGTHFVLSCDIFRHMDMLYILCCDQSGSPEADSAFSEEAMASLMQSASLLSPSSTSAHRRSISGLQLPVGTTKAPMIPSAGKQDVCSASLPAQAGCVKVTRYSAGYTMHARHNSLTGFKLIVPWIWHNSLSAILQSNVVHSCASNPILTACDSVWTEHHEEPFRWCTTDSSIFAR